ncbi:MAG: branched-chain amino acid aminotransferase [Alistipes sp.]|nr:branched-chain amino acid aminotransferase [Alistipes sp.]
MTDFYLYQTLHLCHGRVRLLDRHVGLLDRCARELFDRRYAPDLQQLERQVLDFADAQDYPTDLSSFVRLELTSEGEVRFVPAGVSYYEGYALRSLQPDGVGILYEPPLNGYPTQARMAAVATARRMAECAGGRVAVQCGADGMCRSIEGAPLAAVQGYTVWLASESVPYEIPATRFELRMEGAPVRGHRFVAPRSVEHRLLGEAVEAAGLTLREGPFDMDFLAGADEVFWLDYRGITALAHCDGRPLMSIIAERIAIALEGIFKE